MLDENNLPYTFEQKNNFFLCLPSYIGGLFFGSIFVGVWVFLVPWIVVYPFVFLYLLLRN